MKNFNHSLTHAFRNLKHNLLYTSLTVLGLIIGLTLFMLTAVFVYGEYTVDHCYTDYGRIYRLYDEEKNDCYLDYNLGEVILQNVPDVESVVMVDQMEYPVVLKNKNKGVRFNSSICTDNSFFEVFSLTTLKQLESQPFADKNSIILTHSAALKLFGNQEALGQFLNYDGFVDLRVTAIIADFPENSSIKADILLNSDEEELRFTSECDGDCYYVMNCFLKKGENASVVDIVDKINQEIGDNAIRNNHVAIQELSSVYLDEYIEGNNNRLGNLSFIRVLSIIALVILSLAVINFINFSVTLQKAKVKEIYIKRINGASNHHLFGYFVSESMLIILFSFLCAALFAFVLNGVVSGFVETNLIYGNLFSPTLVLLCITIGVLLILLNSIFPLYAIHKFVALNALSAKKEMGSKGIFSNSILLIQFTASIVLLVATFVITKQLKFIDNQDLGFSKANLINIELPFNYEHKEALTNEVAKLNFIESFSFSDGKPGNINKLWGSGPAEDDFILNTIICDARFIETFEIEMTQGKSFGLGDENTACILNEAAIKAFEWTSIENKTIERNHPEVLNVVGVAKDFSISTSHTKIEPTCLIFRDITGDSFSVRLKTGNRKQQIAEIEEMWNNITPSDPFVFEFYDSFFERLYKKEQKLAKSISWLAIVAIALTVIGILGQVMQICVNRTKEIGIRKVNGANEFEIVKMLNQNFIRWLVFAFLLACPIGYFIMDKWLQNFAYKTTLSWWLFLLAGFVALVVTVFSISFQTIRAARRNPIDSLRYE